MLCSDAIIGALALASVVAIGLRVLPVVYASLAPAQDLGRKYGRDRWALVTGASSGIGTRFVRRLLSQGFRVIAVSLPDTNSVASCADDRVLRIDVDLSDPVAAIDIIERATHGLDVAVVISNAGSALVKPFHTIPDAMAVTAYVAANAAAHAALAQHFYRRMLNNTCKGGAIIFTSSAMARLPASHAELYCASKAFMERLALALSPAARSNGLDVLAVLPGAVSQTRFLDALDASCRKVGVLRAVYTIAQTPDAVVDAVFRCVGRFGLVAVDSGFLAVTVSLADALLSANFLSVLVGTIVFGQLFHPLFSSYTDLHL